MADSEHGGTGPAGAGDPDVTEFADGSVSLALAAVDASAARARRYVRGRWSELDDEVLQDVQLIVSELVSNAVRHGRPQIEMHLRLARFTVDVGVLDHHPALPDVATSSPAASAASGRGLLLVDSLARCWGVEPLADGTGKTVWASVGTS